MSTEESFKDWVTQFKKELEARGFVATSDTGSVKWTGDVPLGPPNKIVSQFYRRQEDGSYLPVGEPHVTQL